MAVDRTRGQSVSSSSPEITSIADRLDSWKEIAAYLDRSLSTVQRWEREEALPVHRHQHKSQGSVFTYKSEINVWWRERGDRLIQQPDSKGAGEEVAGDSVFRENATVASRPKAWLRFGALSTVLAVSIAVTIVLSGLAVWYRKFPAFSPHVIRTTQLTRSGRATLLTSDFLPYIVSDGTRLYFTELTESGSRIVQVALSGGEVQPLQTQFRQSEVVDISKDGSKLLVITFETGSAEGRVWIVPTVGGAPQRVGGVFGHDAAWFPDGKKLLYAVGEELHVTDPNGSNARRFLRASGRPHWLRWSPDGTSLRFTAVRLENNSRSLWESSSDGKMLRPLLGGWNSQHWECCGDWTPDQKYFIFTAVRGGWSGSDKIVSSPGPLDADLWLLEERQRVLGAAAVPVRLTTTPIQFGGALPAKDGNRLFVAGGKPSAELVAYDAKSGSFLPYLGGGLKEDLDFTRDGKWVTYLHNGYLWRSRVDGTQSLQLTAVPMMTLVLRWSPDGNSIAFMGREAGKSWKIYVVSANGGSLEQVMDSQGAEADPGWSPDGNVIVFGRPPDYMAEFASAKAIYLFDRRTRQISTLPGSEGLFSPRWSASGRFIVAMSLDQQRLMLFDFNTQKWSELARHNAHNPAWSKDETHVYFQSTFFFGGGAEIFRVRIRDRRLQRVVGPQELGRSNLSRFLFNGITPEGSPLVVVGSTNSDIYALEWQTR